MIDVSMKNLLLQMESKSIRDSCIRFCSEEAGEGGDRGQKEKEKRS